jgi:hypothetical protein
MLHADNAYIVIKYLIEHAEELAREHCFYSDTVEELMEEVDYLKASLELCRIPNKK